MGEHLTVNDINDLTSNVIYNHFERGDGNCDNVPFYGDIMNELKLHYNLKHIYDKLAKAVCYVYWRKAYHTNFDTDLCTYLYYWVGDKIYSIVSNKAVFSKIINAFFGELYMTDKGEICPYPNYSIDEDIFHKNKMLFDYSMNYKHIDLNTISGDTRCDEGYIEYIKKYIVIYNDAHFNCTVGDQKKYDCKYFRKLFQNYDHRKLKSFHCTQDKAQPQYTDVQRSVEQTKHSLHEPQGLEGNNGLVGIHVSLGDNKQYERQVPYENLGLSEHNELDKTLSHNTNNTTENGSSKTIAGSVAPVLGVSSISLLLYKVTPLGGYINRLLGRNRNMYNNIEYMDTFNPYSEGMDPVGRRMNISYNRL